MRSTPTRRTAVIVAATVVAAGLAGGTEHAVPGQAGPLRIRAPILTDLITTLPPTQRYTYVYNGVSQVLDHILVSPALRRVTYQVVHVNGE